MLVTVLIPVCLVVSIIICRQGLGVLRNRVGRRTTCVGQTISLSKARCLTRLSSISRKAQIALVTSAKSILCSSEGSKDAVRGRGAETRMRRTLGGKSNRGVHVSSAMDGRLCCCTILLSSKGILHISGSVSDLV